jgi:hypothetical protein
MLKWLHFLWLSVQRSKIEDWKDMMRMYLPVRILAAIALCLMFQEAHAAAVDDIALVVSSDICDGSNPPDKSFVIYATNTNQSKRISANFKYDSAPSGLSFTLRDANLTLFTDQFPKFHEKRLAPGERAKVGCTINYRSSPTPKSYTAVPIVITTAGAVYVDPSKPEPPPDKATDFVAFFPQVGFAACTGGPRPAGLLFIENLHPYQTLSVTVEMAGNKGKPPDHFSVTLAPLAATRIGCSNGFASPIRVSAADLSGNV